jgi:outer membrane protein assembly factor BamB
MKKIIYLYYILFLTSCIGCKDEMLSDNVFWKTALNQKSLIYDSGLGYPTYKNTVVFHSTPEPWGDILGSILHGLDTDTGKEKWRLSNVDFEPKVSLQFNNVDYFYQYENVVVCGDFQYKDTGNETYVYAIDIQNGKVLWVKEFTNKGLQFGRMVVGNGKYAYVDFQKNNTEFSLIKIDIETGFFTEIFKFSQANIPDAIKVKEISFDQMSQIYTNSIGDEFVAFSLSGYNYETDRYKAYMTLCVYSLTQNKIVYSKYINNQTLGKDEWDDFYGRVTFHNEKLFIGKGRCFYCVDAFEDKGMIWQYATGPYGNDNVMQVLGYDNIALGYTVDRLFAFDINTGEKLYDMPSGGSATASIIDGIIYQRDGSDLQMRDPRTGKELKRVSTPPNEQAFSSSRPNGADGKIFIHSYTHAYCIKAWGK